jgi:transcriptional regulator with XRE-family HTH domain
MKIGHKIRQLREGRNLSQENMAEALKISVTGYGKIERNEVDINIERLQEIAQALQTKPEDILAFDEKYIFNSYDKSVVTGQVINNTSISDPERKLYEAHIALLNEKIAWLEKGK